MSPAAAQKCSSPACTNPVSFRSREAIADALRTTISQCESMRVEYVQRYRSLTAHLWWLEGELMGLCCDCVLARAAQFRADAIEAAMLGPDSLHAPAPRNVPHFRKRDLF